MTEPHYLNLLAILHESSADKSSLLRPLQSTGLLVLMQTARSSLITGFIAVSGVLVLSIRDILSTLALLFLLVLSHTFASIHVSFRLILVFLLQISTGKPVNASGKDPHAFHVFRSLVEVCQAPVDKLSRAFSLALLSWKSFWICNSNFLGTSKICKLNSCTSYSP